MSHTKPPWAKNSYSPCESHTVVMCCSTWVLTEIDSYYQSYKMIRDITGVGEGKGPVIAFHDGFDGYPQWAGFLHGADRIAIGAPGFVRT